MYYAYGFIGIMYKKDDARAFGRNYQSCNPVYVCSVSISRRVVKEEKAICTPWRGSISPFFDVARGDIPHCNVIYLYCHQANSFIIRSDIFRASYNCTSVGILSKIIAIASFH